LFLFSLDTQRRTQLTAPHKNFLGDKLPAFSPDGKSLAFARVEANHSADIYLLNIASGEEKRLTQDNASIAGLDWLSDGEHIIYGSSDDMESKLVQISLAEGTAKKLYSSLDYAGVNLTALANKIAFENVVYQTGIYKKAFRAEWHNTAGSGNFCANHALELVSAIFAGWPQPGLFLRSRRPHRALALRRRWKKFAQAGNGAARFSKRAAALVAGWPLDFV
jgi:hypothetical protein